MYQFISNLQKPAPTSPFDRFRLHDHRCAHEQVISGLRLAGGLVGGFVVLILAGKSMILLIGGTPVSGRLAHFEAWAVLFAASMVILFTANRWASFVPSFFALALVRDLGVIVFAATSSSWIASGGITRNTALQLLGVSAAVIVLTWRFVGDRPAPTRLRDRVSLTILVLGMLMQIVIPYHWPPWPLIASFSVLFIVWFVDRWNHLPKRRKRENGGSGVVETLPER
jgi:hypothetical protein